MGFDFFGFRVYSGRVEVNPGQVGVCVGSGFKRLVGFKTRVGCRVFYNHKKRNFQALFGGILSSF